MMMGRSGVFVLFSVLISNGFCALPQRIHIGAIFDNNGDEKHDLAFKFAVEKVNQRLSQTVLRGKQLEPEILKVAPGNSYQAQRATCNLLSKGVVGIFGPQSDASADHIRSITDTMEIPFIDTRWDYEPPAAIPGRTTTNDYTVNLHPNVHSLGSAFVELVVAYGWDAVTILYQDNHSLNKLQAIFDQTAEVIFPHSFSIVSKQLIPTEEEGFRDILREVFQSKSKNIILDCSRDLISDILKQAQQIGMMSDEYSYFLTSLDAHTVDFEDYKHGGTNFTMFRLIDTNTPDVQSLMKTIVTRRMNKVNAYGFSHENNYMDTQTALVYDSVLLFAFALSELKDTQDISIKKLDCDQDQSWPHGSSLINYMKMIEFKGLSGYSKFDTNGLRTDFNLDILEVKKSGMVPFGSWNPIDGLNISRNTVVTTVINPMNLMANKTFIITLIENPPYTMLKEETRKLEGNNRFEGFAIDLINEIANVLHFNVTLKLVDDGNYGSQSEHGNWNGMIQEVLVGSEHGGADFAVADLSITTSRASAVEFSIPWMTLGISIIYIKPRPAPPDMLSFLSPFTLEVWIYTGISLVLVSLALYVLARFSPYEWDSPYPCIEEPEELENQFNVSNSFWFTIGSLMQQGSDVAPIGTSTRLLAGIWFFFALIMIASYTANLAAFLTVETLDKPIESAEDLSKQEVIKYGVVSGGSTMNFFKTSKFEVYQRMWEFMSGSHKEEVMVKSNSEGIQKVIDADGKYAFMMESSSIEYVVERKCTVSQVGGLLDNKGYGIAMAPGTPYKKFLDNAILHLQEGGVLFKLKTKWWKRKRGGGACNNAGGGGAVAELGLPNVIGVFIVTFAGCMVAVISAIAELLYGAKLQSEEMETSWLTEIKEEIRFAFICHGTSKTVRKPPSSDDGGSSSSGCSSSSLSRKSFANRRFKSSNHSLNSEFGRKEGDESGYGRTNYRNPRSSGGSSNHKKNGSLRANPFEDDD